MGGKRITHEQFIQELYNRNSNANNIEILGKYTKKKTPIECRCKIDNYIWTPTPQSLLNGHGCPKCGNNIKKTHEEFIQEMNEINPNIEILEEYVNTNTKIKCRCKIDGYEWSTTPNSLLRSSGCSQCYNNRRGNDKRKTHEEFMQEFYEKNPKANNIEILEIYISALTPIKCRCKIDRHEWSAKPNDLLRGYGCAKCYGNIKKTTKQFIQEMNEINPNIEILGEYVSATTKIKCKCKIDGYEWNTKPNILLSNHGCPQCNSSKGELTISEYLKDNSIDFIPQYRFENCKYKYTLPFDFYLPNLNVVIEFDGEQHFEIVEYFGGLDGFIDTKIRDTIKNIYCKDNNIKLIRIPYWEFENIEEILNKELSL